MSIENYNKRYTEIHGQEMDAIALADVAMYFPNGWTGRLGVHARLEYAETLMDAWWNWFIEKGYAVAGQPGLGNAIDELYEESPFVW